jgi:hypothetical protein
MTKAVVKGQLVEVTKENTIFIRRCTFGGYVLDIPNEPMQHGTMYGNMKGAEEYARRASRRLGLPVVREWDTVDPIETPYTPWTVRYEKDPQGAGGMKASIYGATGELIAVLSLHKAKWAQLIVDAVNKEGVP